MFQYVKNLYGSVFSDADVDNFVKVGWITKDEAKEIKGV